MWFLGKVPLVLHLLVLSPLLLSDGVSNNSSVNWIPPRSTIQRAISLPASPPIVANTSSSQFANYTQPQFRLLLITFINLLPSPTIKPPGFPQLLPANFVCLAVEFIANPMDKSPPTNRLTVSSLLSPPEMERSNSFGTAMPLVALQYPKVDLNTNMQYQLPQLPMFKMPAYASPPISPFNTQSQKENMDNASEQGTLDPPLFRRESTTGALASDVPLFSSQSSSQEIITQHMQSESYQKLPVKPTEDEYKVAVEFHAKVFKNVFQSTKVYNSWRARERLFEERYRAPAAGVQKRPSPKKLAPAPAPRSRQPKMALPKASPRPAREPKLKRTPKAQILSSFEEHIGSVSPKAARPATTRDDLDYNAIPDYSPPLESLAGNEKKLKAEWKGNKLDLSNDADRHLLHEAELELASTLRLSCATYLCSKRRVFQARINALRIGKEFRRTDAQQACKIDVNKASKLWQAYDKVGWFDADYFRQYV